MINFGAGVTNPVLTAPCALRRLGVLCLGVNLKMQLCESSNDRGKFVIWNIFE